MNNRNIKLALSVGLINANKNSNLLSFIEEIMKGFQEVGTFLGLTNTNKKILNANNIRESYSLQFEHCILDVDLVSNPQTKNQVIQSFNLR